MMASTHQESKRLLGSQPAPTPVLMPLDGVGMRNSWPPMQVYCSRLSKGWGFLTLSHPSHLPASFPIQLVQGPLSVFLGHQDSY